MVLRIAGGDAHEHRSPEMTPNSDYQIERSLQCPTVYPATDIPTANIAR
jgi:hypothetical protein